MREEKLLNAIGQIDDELITRANVPVKYRRRYGMYLMGGATVAAAVLLLVVGAENLWKKGGNTAGIPNVSTEPTKVAAQKTEAPSITPSSQYALKDSDVRYIKKNSLTVLDVSFAVEGLGGGGGIGHLVVKTENDMLTGNPTRDQIELMNSIKELPVFEMEENLSTTLGDEENHVIKEDAVYFEPSKEFTIIHYNFYGEKDYETITYKCDSKKSITDQLLDYTFHRVEYRDYYGYGDGSFEVMKAPSSVGMLYPIITVKEAEQKLRKGEFYCYGEEVEVAKTAKILAVEIEYVIQEGIKYIQPFYKFTITDDSWDVSEIMKSYGVKDTSPYFTVSEVYIPAVQEQYLNKVEPKLLYQ